MKKLVICNKANNPKCLGCNHDEPHEPIIENKMKCTQWVECIDENDDPIFKVRCIEYKGDKNE